MRVPIYRDEATLRDKEIASSPTAEHWRQLNIIYSELKLTLMD